jgi:hypothetical protein
MIELPQPVAVVCHDAGSANIILAELEASPGHYLPVMQGPAQELWRAAGYPSEQLLSLATALAQARSVLSGTGWASDLEHRARREARALGLRSAAVIDHWINYEERFERDGEVVLPDEFWVSDAEGFELASRCFAGAVIRQRPNLYLRRQLDAIKAAGKPDPTRVLYLLEPIRYSWPGLSQAGEFEALEFLAAHLKLLKPSGSVRLRLRPHPSDPPGKYDAWLAVHHELDAAIDDKESLAEAIAAAQWVAGCETVALVVALAANRKVVATLPPQAPRCRLPQHGLLHLRDVPGASWPAANPAPPVHR